MEVWPSAQSSSQKQNFVNTSKRLLENRNWTFPVVRYFTWKLEFFSNTFSVLVVKFNFLFYFMRCFHSLLLCYLHFLLWLIHTTFNLNWMVLFVKNSKKMYLFENSFKALLMTSHQIQILVPILITKTNIHKTFGKFPNQPDLTIYELGWL